MVILGQFITAFGLIALAILALVKGIRRPINNAFAIMCFFGAAWVICSAAIEILLLQNINPLIISRLSMAFASYMAASILVFCLYFPDTRPKSGLISVIYLLASFIAALSLTGLYIRDFKLVDHSATREFSQGIYVLFFSILAFVSLALSNLLIKYYQHSAQKKSRVQITYVLAGFIVGFSATFLVSFVLPLIGINSLFFLGYIGPLVFFISSAYAILKYRLMDISLVIKKTTAYSLVTFAITFFYVLVVILFESLFRSFYGYYSFWASIPAAFVIAVTFVPVRSHLQGLTDQIFFRRTVEYQQVIKDVTKLIVSVTDLNTLFRLIDRTIVRAMCVKNVAVLLFEEKAKHYLVEKTNGHPVEFLKQELSPDSALAQYLSETKDAVVLEECQAQLTSPISNKELKDKMRLVCDELKRFGAVIAIPSFTKGRLVGILCLGEKLSGELYSPEDLELLLTMAQEAGIAIENAKLYRDITETRDYLNDLVQGSDDAILTLDLSGKVTSWNKGAERIFGYSNDEVMEKHPPFLTNDELQDFINRIISNETVKAIELEKATKSGKDLPLLMTISPIHDQSEQIIGLSMIIKDISSLRKVEQLKHEFLSVVSHELRTPLTPIKGYLSLLIDERLGKLEIKQKEALKVILNQSNHLHDLIDSVIDISRIESGRPLELQKEPLFVEEVIQASLDASANAIAAKQINLTMICPSEKLAIMADRKKLLRAFDNILGNAIKFTPIKGEISVAIAKDGEKLKVMVADSGIGLEEGDLENIFKPFFQVDTSYTRSCGGIGMGLAIAKEIIEAHEGRIWAESDGLGKGSRFVFII